MKRKHLQFYDVGRTWRSKNPEVIHPGDFWLESRTIGKAMALLQGLVIIHLCPALHPSIHPCPPSIHAPSIPPLLSHPHSLTRVCRVPQCVASTEETVEHTPSPKTLPVMVQRQNTPAKNPHASRMGYVLRHTDLERNSGVQLAGVALHSKWHLIQVLKEFGCLEQW